MHYPDHPTADYTDPLKPQFRPRDDAQGIVGTRVTADWLNDVGNNAMKAVTAAGIVPTKGREDDVTDAIVRLAAGRDAGRSKLARDVAGGVGEIILTDAEAGASMLILTGARTGDLLLSWPDSYSGVRWVYNGSTGGHAITSRVVTQAAGAAITLPAGQWSLVAITGTTLAVLLSNAGTGAGATGQAIEQGLHTIWLPASALTPRVSSGPAVGTLVSANGQVYPYLAFDPAIDKGIDCAIGMPKSWDGGNLQVELVWCHPASTGLFSVQFLVTAAAMSDGGAMAAAPGSAGTIQDVGGVADTLYVSPRSTAFTVGGVGQVICLTLSRDADDASDQLSVDARLIGLRLLYTVGAATDA